MGSNQLTLNELEIKPINKQSPIPFYRQVQMDLLALLQTEELQPGDMLPAETELAEFYQVSRQTIRQAIGLLVSEGLVERTPGRGTTIKVGRSRIKFFLDKSFAKQMVDMGLTPYSEVLQKKIVVINEKAPISLQKKAGSSALKLVRLRYGVDTQIGVQYSYTITELCPDLNENDFKVASLYNLLLTHYKIPIARLDQTINAIIGEKQQTDLLNVPEGSPLLVVNSTAYLENGDPIEASIGYFRSDKYEYSITHRF